MTVLADEFLRRFLLHVLPDSFQRIRHYGLLSNRHRARTRPMSRTVGDAGANPGARTQLPGTWQQLTGHDPLQCPQCRNGKMVRIAILPFDPVQRCDSS